MNINFKYLREQLLQFKRADCDGRNIILEAAVLEIKNLPHQIQNKESAMDAYKKMSFVATLLNYADALRRIENQDFFDILIDFKMVNLFEKPCFKTLNDYFAFHKTKPQMRLKKPISDIPIKIWQLFRTAQKAQLELTGRLEQFNLDELDILNLPQDQLYPLPIQMMARYENEAVDRIGANKAGQYLFAKKFGAYLLPGGGMVEIDLELNQETFLHKMLDEHLEEENSNLWIKARDYYNQIERNVFLATMIHCIAKHSKLEENLENINIRKQLDAALATGKANAAILADMIRLIDELKAQAHVKKKEEKLLFINSLRAMIQVEPFKLTALYQEAYEFIKSNTAYLKIEQFGDTRVAGGKQFSNCFLMIGEPLEVWFSHKFSGYSTEFGDDLIGFNFEYLTLLQALANFRYVKYSHILIVLANQMLCFEQNTLNFNETWNSGEFQEARKSLINEAHI